MMAWHSFVDGLTRASSRYVPLYYYYYDYYYYRPPPFGQLTDAIDRSIDCTPAEPGGPRRERAALQVRVLRRPPGGGTSPYIIIIIIIGQLIDAIDPSINQLIELN